MSVKHTELVLEQCLDRLVQQGLLLELELELELELVVVVDQF
jgi:hypothetical protein